MPILGKRVLLLCIYITVDTWLEFSASNKLMNVINYQAKKYCNHLQYFYLRIKTLFIHLENLGVTLSKIYHELLIGLAHWD